MTCEGIVVTDDGISFKQSRDSTSTLSPCDVIPWRDVLSVEVPPDNSRLLLHYIHHSNNSNVWKCQQQCVQGGGAAQQYCQLIGQHLQKLGRPRRVQVLINAISGGGDGQSVYRCTVQPILERAGVHATLHVTKYHRHMEHIVENMELDNVDCIILMGGDGSYQELLHSLIPRVQRQKGVDVLDSGVDLHPVAVPIAVIPTGTGNGIAQGAYGCVDVETAVLHAVTGRCRPVNVVSIQTGQELTYCGLVASLGSWCRLQERADGMRWLGTLRHKVGRFSAYLLKNETFEMEISYKSVLQGSHRRKEKDPVDELSDEERQERGETTGINVFPPGFFEDDSRSKLRWNQDGDGMLVVMETPTTRWRYATWMKDMQSMKKKALHYDFIKSFHACHLHLSLHQHQHPHSSKISVDGEIRPLTSGDVHFRVHRNVINLVSSPTSELNI